MRASLLLLAILWVLPLGAEALYIETGHLIPISGGEIEGGVVVVENGRIRAAGPPEEVKAPPFARRIDATSQVVMPGLVVPLSRIGMPAPKQAPRAGDAPYRPVMEAWYLVSREFYPFHPDLGRLLEAGVTTLVAVPRGSTGGILGQAAAVRTAPVPIGERFLATEVALVVSVDTRTAWVEAVPKAFEKTREELKKEKEKEKAEAEKQDGGQGKEKSDAKPPPDPAKEGLRRAVEGKVPVLLVELTAGEWETFRAGMDLEGLRLVAEHSFDLDGVADSLAEHEVTVLAQPVLTYEPFTRLYLNRPALYADAGVKVAFPLPRDDVRGASEMLSALAEMARSGMGREEVLRAATLGPATALGLDRQVGSMAAGREADLLFLSGDPLDPTTRIERVMARGEFVTGGESDAH